MNWLIPIISAIAWRLDGWGKGDSFLPFWPFTKPNWKIGGINYARYAIGFAIALFTANYWYILTYPIVLSVPYGEKHWWMKYGILGWFCVGALFGGASLSWGNALWCGMLLVGMKFIDMDWAWTEFLFGGLGTMIYVFR